MKNRFLTQASHEFYPKQRAITLSFLAPIFLFLLPFLLIGQGIKLDSWSRWPFTIPKPYNRMVGWGLVLPIWPLALWPIYSQFTIGRGTPVSLMATRQLVGQALFKFCHHPISLRTIIGSMDVGILFRSIGVMILVILFSSRHILYSKPVEEKKMEIRFGQQYIDYKKRRPFLIPRFLHRPKNDQMRPFPETKV